MERERIHAKIKKKSVVRRSDGRVRKVVRSRVEQEVYYIKRKRKKKIRSEKVDKQRRQSTRDDGR